MCHRQLIKKVTAMGTPLSSESFVKNGVPQGPEMLAERRPGQSFEFGILSPHCRQGLLYFITFICPTNEVLVPLYNALVNLRLEYAIKANLQCLIKGRAQCKKN